MADETRRIDYYYVSVPDKPGEGSRILTALHQATCTHQGGTLSEGMVVGTEVTCPGTAPSLM